MAQHIPTGAFHQKIFRTIEEGIAKDVAHWSRYRGLKGSLKYEDATDHYAEEPGEEVYLTERHIGSGIVWGSTRGTIEVHVKDFKTITAIYLVA